MRNATASAVMAGILLAVAARGDPGEMTLRFGPGYVTLDGAMPQEHQRLEPLDGSPFGLDWSWAGDRVEASADAALGVAIDFEVGISQRFGVEIGLGYSEHDVRFDRSSEVANGSIFGTHGRVLAMPLTVGLNFHPWKWERADLFLGPVVGYVLFEDQGVFGGCFSVGFCDFDFGRHPLGIQDALTYGAVVGLDLPLRRSGWLLSVRGRYLTLTAELEQGGSRRSESSTLDLWRAEIGFGYRF